MAISLIEGLMDELQAKDKDGVITTVEELRRNQFGFPLRHYAQQYLFGSTGLRIKVFHSIAGLPASCKSPLLFDLMGHVCAPQESGGLGGMGFLYELEDKISPTLLSSVLSLYGDMLGGSLRVLRDQTLEQAFTHIATNLIPAYRKKVPDCSIPVIVGLDSIGGAASDDTVRKIETEGYVGKGYHEKPHIMKYFCENASKVIGEMPLVVVCVNQEKEAAASVPFAAPQKKITGGVSQLFKDGHMVSASFKKLNDGKLVILRTTKTSFCDDRRIEVEFRWNRYGSSLDDAYGHRFEWELASARCLADPDKGVGEIRDIAAVSVSDKNLVTCPQLNCRSVKPEEFEAALMSEEFRPVREQLYAYQKIEPIRSIDEYAAYIASRRGGKAPAEPRQEKPKDEKPRAKPKAKTQAPKQAPETVPYTEEAADAKQG